MHHFTTKMHTLTTTMITHILNINKNNRLKKDKMVTFA